ncbi:MAG TPA: arsenite methyltransferase [Candidatus Kapabacteria bacterium]|nr:arsenite methyltransferase [Candidatus Kapabacteria bacterium]
MKSSDELKEIVKEKYGEIAKASEKCGCGCSPQFNNTTNFSIDYSDKEGYNKDADLGLGCGIPTDFADIKKGDYVLDLGSGAGNDCFVALSLTGDEGKVYGLDFTDEMIKKANLNKIIVGASNVEFVKGDIEDMPFESDFFDVVISNCVLNLVPNKELAFSNIYRVLKPNGHFCVSDIVLEGKLPKEIESAAVMYAGCVAGALQKQDYLDAITKAGFKNVEIKKNRKIELPDSNLLELMSKEELEKYRNSGVGIYSITVVGYR